MEIVFYNVNGEPTAYCEDGEHIYSYGGDALAYFHNDSVYNYAGKHLGRFSNGWIRDNNGQCAFFTNDATGGPAKPMKSMMPMRSMKSMRPMKSMKSMKPIKPMNSNSWSSKSSINFFY